MERINVNSDTLQFIKERVLTVTDLTRTNKLSEILDAFSDDPANDVFLIQNKRSRTSQAVLVNFDYFQQLLKSKEAYEQLLDQVMLEMVEERQNEEREEGIPLNKVLKENEVDLVKVFELAEKLQLE